MSNASDPMRPTIESDPFSFLKLIAEASALFVAVTFVAGWSYLASYYGTFGLNPVELDIPIPVVATIALHVLYDAVWPLLVLAGLVVALTIAKSQPPVTLQSSFGWCTFAYCHNALSSVRTETPVSVAIRRQKIRSRDRVV